MATAFSIVFYKEEYSNNYNKGEGENIGLDLILDIVFIYLIHLFI